MRWNITGKHISKQKVKFTSYYFVNYFKNVNVFQATTKHQLNKFWDYKSPLLPRVWESIIIQLCEFVNRKLFNALVGDHTSSLTDISLKASSEERNSGSLLILGKGFLLHLQYKHRLMQQLWHSWHTSLHLFCLRWPTVYRHNHKL